MVDERQAKNKAAGETSRYASAGPIVGAWDVSEEEADTMSLVLGCALHITSAYQEHPPHCTVAHEEAQKAKLCA